MIDCWAGYDVTMLGEPLRSGRIIVVFSTETWRQPQMLFRGSRRKRSLRQATPLRTLSLRQTTPRRTPSLRWTTPSLRQTTPRRTPSLRRTTPRRQQNTLPLYLNTPRLLSYTPCPHWSTPRLKRSTAQLSSWHLILKSTPHLLQLIHLFHLVNTRQILPVLLQQWTHPLILLRSHHNLQTPHKQLRQKTPNVLKKVLRLLQNIKPSWSLR